VAALLGRCTFPDPAAGPLHCAVSGGADSTALLALAAATDSEVTAHHVDHGLRPGSADEALVVREHAARLGTAFVGHRVRLADGPDLEARARAARREVLPAGVCTGHTADDQAETVLLNLLRGSGTAGLAGMRAGLDASGRGARHPILGLRRSETEALCRALGLVVVHDPSNGSSRFTRNRIRHEALPLLRDIAARDVTPILVRHARLAREDEDLLGSLAAGIDPTDARALAAAPPALARRSVRRWLAAADPDGYPPDEAGVERVLQVARGASRACELAGGLRVHRRGQVLSLRPADGRRTPVRGVVRGSPAQRGAARQEGQQVG